MDKPKYVEGFFKAEKRLADYRTGNIALDFWELLRAKLNHQKSWDKEALAHAMHTEHGKATLHQAMYWLDHYATMLQNAGMVEVTHTKINVISP